MVGIDVLFNSVIIIIKRSTMFVIPCVYLKHIEELVIDDRLIMNLEQLVEQSVHCRWQLCLKSELVHQERCVVEQMMPCLKKNIIVVHSINLLQQSVYKLVTLLNV